MSKQATSAGSMSASRAQRGRRHRTAIGTAALVVVLATLSMTGTAAAAPTGGNAPAAKACQKDGYQSLARSESPTVAFTSSDECTSYAAEGGRLVAVADARSVDITYTLSYTHEFLGDVCRAHLQVDGFEPNTTYQLTITDFNATARFPITTDSTGAFSQEYGDQVEDGTRALQLTVDGVSSPVRTVSC